MDAYLSPPLPPGHIPGVGLALGLWKLACDRHWPQLYGLTSYPALRTSVEKDGNYPSAEYYRLIDSAARAAASLPQGEHQFCLMVYL